MRFSVLVPTRNGGAYLRGCLDSVLGAAGDDVEVVVSDNANEDETATVLAGYAGDHRVRVVRQENLLPVADNWNAAYRASRGEYVLMLGDDDALLPGCFDVLRGLLDAHDDPDCLTYNAFSFVAPDAIAGLKAAHYADPHFHFDDSLAGERELSPGERRRIVVDMFRFRPRIPLNMQTTLVARRAYERLPDGPYRAPFPDHFALNALMLTVGHWVLAPVQPLVVGISSKSFGHHVYSDRQDEGLRYLGIETDFDSRLPGNELLNATYIWLLMLKRAFPTELAGVEVSRGDYVSRQLYAWYRQARLGRLSRPELRRRIRALGARDIAAVLRAVADPENARRLGQAVVARGRAQQLWPGLRPLPGVQDIGQFVAWAGREDAGFRHGGLTRFAYGPCAPSLTPPGDRRRFAFYARARGIDFAIADPRERYDCVVLSARADITRWVRAPREIKVIYDLVDSYLAVPDTSAKSMLRGSAKFVAGETSRPTLSYRRTIEAMCIRADAVVCSTNEQREQIRPLCPNVHVILDAQDHLVRRTKTDYAPSGNGLSLVWEGLPENVAGFAGLRAALEELGRERELTVHLITDAQFHRYGGRWGRQHSAEYARRFLPRFELHEWSEQTLADVACAADIAVIPLDVDDPLAAGKPENKLLLMWRMGLPVVTSRTPAYARAMAGAGLNLTCADSDEWLATLRHLAASPSDRAAAGAAGLAYARRHHSDDQIVRTWDGVLDSIGVGR